MAEADLETFIRLVAPYQVVGGIHSEWCSWTTSAKAGGHQITLLPRDHGKSRYIAFKVAWYIVKRPDIRILYISSTAGLAEKQLGFIKQILESSIVRRYWPDLVHADKGKRAKWDNSEIAVDHPKRKEEGIRDPTVFTGGLTTNLVGMHCDVAVLDDVVTGDNAYTQEGRDKVKTQFSLLSSIEGGDAEEWVVGTRYHPKDLYSEMLAMQEEVFDDRGEVIDYLPVYQTFERQVEDSGDGNGQFLWPRQQRADGKWFGFDAQILARKRAKYLDRTQYYSQYYNNPNSSENGGISRNKFQYYEPNNVKNIDGNWYVKDKKINVFASVDFAYSLGKRSDYTAIAVIGIDRDRNVFVLEIDRFRTDRISEYFEHIRDLYVKWGFRKLGAEVTSGQRAIVKELKESYFKPYGLSLSVEELAPTRTSGSKQERMSAVLEPRYDNLSIWHYRGGNCQTLEDELVMQHPPHDDCMDSLSCAISIAIPPVGMFGRDGARRPHLVSNSRFGGITA
jgi:phage terminase large subunit-like protein